MSTTFQEFVTLEKVNCGQCGGLFSLNQEFLERARSNKGGYNCPYCQTRWSWNESEADRLRKRLESRDRELREAKCETMRRQQLLDEERAKTHIIERKLKRTSVGVCPCCNRTFKQLAAHMKQKHPEFKK